MEEEASGSIYRGVEDNLFDFGRCMVSELTVSDSDLRFFTARNLHVHGIVGGDETVDRSVGRIWLGSEPVRTPNSNQWLSKSSSVWIYVDRDVDIQGTCEYPAGLNRDRTATFNVSLVAGWNEFIGADDEDGNRVYETRDRPADFAWYASWTYE